VNLRRLAAPRARVTIRGVGTFELALFTTQAPAAVLHFAHLTESGCYNGLTFQRVVAHCGIPGGSPGGSENSGDARFMPDEVGLWQERGDAATVRRFTGGQPASARGQFALARILLAEGDRTGAQSQVREAWRSEELSERLEAEVLEVFRDLLTGAMDVYLSTVSNRLNSVMKQLTIIATVFLPLSWITGFFGQNFGFMVKHIGRWETFIVLGLGSELLVLAALLVFFKRRGWF